MSLRKMPKNRGSFPNHEAVFKVLWLALRNASKKWTMPMRNWKQSMNRLAILFEERMVYSDLIAIYTVNLTGQYNEFWILI